MLCLIFSRSLLANDAYVFTHELFDSHRIGQIAGLVHLPLQLRRRYNSFKSWTVTVAQSLGFPSRLCGQGNFSASA